MVQPHRRDEPQRTPLRFHPAEQVARYDRPARRDRCWGTLVSSFQRRGKSDRARPPQLIRSIHQNTARFGGGVLQGGGVFAGRVGVHAVGGGVPNRRVSVGRVPRGFGDAQPRNGGGGSLRQLGNRLPLQEQSRALRADVHVPSGRARARERVHPVERGRRPLSSQRQGRSDAHKRDGGQPGVERRSAAPARRVQAGGDDLRTRRRGRVLDSRKRGSADNERRDGYAQLRRMERPGRHRRRNHGRRGGRRIPRLSGPRRRGAAGAEGRAVQ